MAARVSRRAYKEVRLQQLRSFCETARLGSLKAAADALGLAQPTVWEQVHALEREFGSKLVEPHGRGCQLTEAGRVLAGLAAPLVAGIDALKHHFASARERVETWMTLATTQRILVEDLPRPIREFERRQPHVRLRFLELSGDNIAAAVKAREADLGLTVEREPSPPNPWLEFEPVYELEPLLIAPKDHPLARRRVVRPQDLKGHAFVNSPSGGFADKSIAAILEKLDVFQAQPPRVEAGYTAVIRRYVELGFGIGIVPGVPDRSPASNLHERPMGRYFGQVTVNLIWRKGAVEAEPLRSFAETVKELLRGRPRTGRRSR
ncbi:MAG: LysR family transcriptional regulator [Gemmataceae bacterium]|nr:LysR family transcriptional regulator [Gemmataceae bacterium]